MFCFILCFKETYKANSLKISLFVIDSWTKWYSFQEREKKLRKKEATLQPNTEEQPTEKSETDEPKNSENVEEAIETPAPAKAKVQQNPLKHRKPIKTRVGPPKGILKKKKSDNYLLWGSAAAAAVAVLLLLVLGYKYFLWVGNLFLVWSTHRYLATVM